MKTKYYILLLFFIIVSSFTYGYFVKRNKIFPYKIIKEIFGNKTGTDILVEKAEKKQWYKNMWNERYNKIMLIFSFGQQLAANVSILENFQKS